jgi:hypothetical protein
MSREPPSIKAVRGAFDDADDETVDDPDGWLDLVARKIANLRLHFKVSDSEVSGLRLLVADRLLIRGSGQPAARIAAEQAVPEIRDIVRKMATHTIKKVGLFRPEDDDQRSEWVAALAAILKRRHATGGRPRSASPSNRDALIAILIGQGCDPQYSRSCVAEAHSIAKVRVWGEDSAAVDTGNARRHG